MAHVLAKLPDDHREMIILRNLEGLLHEEVAQRMGRTVGVSAALGGGHRASIGACVEQRERRGGRGS